MTFLERRDYTQSRETHEGLPSVAYFLFSSLRSTYWPDPGLPKAGGSDSAAKIGRNAGVLRMSC